jgi:hypothetical protein
MDDLEFSETIQPACLPSKDFNFPDTGSRGVIAGWGLTKNRDFLSAPDFLQNVAVNIYESTRCDLRVGNFSLEVTTESQICLGEIIFKLLIYILSYSL